MGKIISVAINKGGVGKTTITQNLGYLFSKKGIKTLLIDSDPQGNLSQCYNHGEHSYSLNRMYNREEFNPFEVSENLHIVTTNNELEMVVTKLQSYGVNREYVFLDIIEDFKLRDIYDIILIDNPPAFNVMTAVNFTASDYVLSPVYAEILPANGLKPVLNAVSEIRRSLNKSLDLLGIVFNRVKRTNISADLVESVKDDLEDKVFKTVLNDYIVYSKSQANKETIFETEPYSKASYQFLNFFNELTEKILKDG